MSKRVSKKQGTTWNPDLQPDIYPLDVFLTGIQSFRATLDADELGPMFVSQVAEAPLRQVERWFASGMVNEFVADKLACAFGTHIGLVWPSIYWPDEALLAEVA